MSQLWTRYNESLLGIRTEPEPADAIRDPVEPWKGEFSAKAKNPDNFRYSTVGYHHVRKILRELSLGPDDVFCDVGCGMGRVLCLAARYPVRKCVGVELTDRLCTIARRNATSLRGRRAPVEIIGGDAPRADLSEGTVYFLFNPFGPETLQDTLENIRVSLGANPRSIRIVYYHAKYRAAVDNLPWLAPLQEFRSFGGHPVVIWGNRAA